MNAGRIAKAVVLPLFPILLCFLIPACYAGGPAGMKASFNLKHDRDAAVVSIRPSVYAEHSGSIDYRIRIAKQGAAGSSTQSNGGSMDVAAGEDTAIGPLLRFGSFSSGDHLKLELLLCRKGSGCRQDGDVIARFSTSYPDDGASD